MIVEEERGGNQLALHKDDRAIFGGRDYLSSLCWPLTGLAFQ